MKTILMLCLILVSFGCMPEMVTPVPLQEELPVIYDNGPCCDGKKIVWYDTWGEVYPAHDDDDWFPVFENSNIKIIKGIHTQKP